MKTGQTHWQDDCGLDPATECWIVVSVSILSALFFLDVLTTEIILSGGGAEYNPFMTGIVQNPLVHALIKLLLLVLVVLVSRYCETAVNGSSLRIYIVIIGWYLFCVCNNLGWIVSGVGFF